MNSTYAPVRRKVNAKAQPNYSLASFSSASWYLAAELTTALSGSLCPSRVIESLTRGVFSSMLRESSQRFFNIFSLMCDPPSVFDPRPFLLPFCGLDRGPRLAFSDPSCLPCLSASSFGTAKIIRANRLNRPKESIFGFSPGTPWVACGRISHPTVEGGGIPAHAPILIV
jgi:hypothetical protein